MFLFASLIERKSHRTCRGFYFFPSFSKKLQISNFVVFFGARKKTGVKFKTFVTFLLLTIMSTRVSFWLFLFFTKRNQKNQLPRDFF